MLLYSDLKNGMRLTSASSWEITVLDTEIPYLRSDGDIGVGFYVLVSSNAGHEADPWCPEDRRTNRHRVLFLDWTHFDEFCRGFQVVGSSPRWWVSYDRGADYGTVVGRSVEDQWRSDNPGGVTDQHLCHSPYASLLGPSDGFETREEAERLLEKVYNN